jgi:hypothetical protein
MPASRWCNGSLLAQWRVCCWEGSGMVLILGTSTTKLVNGNVTYQMSCKDRLDRVYDVLSALQCNDGTSVFQSTANGQNWSAWP